MKNEKTSLLMFIKIHDYKFLSKIMSHKVEVEKVANSMSVSFWFINTFVVTVINSLIKET